MVPAPIRVLVILYVRIEYIQQSQMVAIWVRKLVFFTVGLLLLIARPDEDARHIKHRDYRENFVYATVLVTCSQQHLREKRVKGHVRHLLSIRGQFSFVIKRADVVKLFKSTHERFRSRRIHVVEVHDVIDAQFLKRQDNRIQIRTLNFRVRVLDEVFGEGSLSEKSVAFAWFCSACTTRSLLGTCP